MVFIFEDILPPEGVEVSLLPLDPKEKLREGPGIKSPGGLAYILGGYEHPDYQPPIPRHGTEFPALTEGRNGYGLAGHSQ